MTIIIEKDNNVLFSYDTTIIPRKGEQIDCPPYNKRYKIASITHNMIKHNNDIKQDTITAYVE